MSAALEQIRTLKVYQMKRKNEAAKIKTSVMVPKEIMAKLRAEAKRTHRSVSGMVAEITMNYLKKQNADLLNM